MNASTEPKPTSTSGRLAGKVAIVTGSSSGLGRAIAFKYASEGAKVVCADLEALMKAPINEQDGIATHDIIMIMGGESVFVKCDVSDSQSFQSLIATAVLHFGRLDIMVNNAGVLLESSSAGLKPINETFESTFDTTLHVNARSVFLGCKYAGIQMIKQAPHACGDRGWIINIASISSMRGISSSVSYNASKGAVINMTKTVALDYAPHRIHCNAICPGFTDTPMMDHFRERDGAIDRLAAVHPFRGLGDPEDIARAAVFLASEDASWITGVPLPVDGGFTAK